MFSQKRVNIELHRTPDFDGDPPSPGPPELFRRHFDYRTVENEMDNDATIVLTAEKNPGPDEDEIVDLDSFNYNNDSVWAARQIDATKNASLGYPQVEYNFYYFCLKVKIFILQGMAYGADLTTPQSLPKILSATLDLPIVHEFSEKASYNQESVVMNERRPVNSSINDLFLFGNQVIQIGSCT